MRNRKKSATVALETLGCKLNQAESESLARKFAEAGYRLVHPSDGADIYILNTCTVTHIADRKSRHLLRLVRRRNPNALVIATGCYAERAPEELARVEAVDMVLGNEEKAQLLQVFGRGMASPASALGPSPVLRTRSLVKIQEGCKQFCSYCIVPLVRGQERSLPTGEVVDEVKAKVGMGYQEVILTGTQIGAYRPSLELLVQRILAETDVARLRLSSLQPQELTPGLISLWADERLCRHLHLPLQSGSDPVLRRMRRRYSLANYERAVAMVREAIRDIALTTDIMVGFPGETEQEFEESYRFCQGMGFANIHVFPYSERPGTLAAQIPGKVGERVKKERSERMLELAREAALRFREQFLGRKMTVLWEKEAQQGVWVGLTDNHIRVFAQSSEPLRNRLLEAKLVGWHNLFDLWADLVN
ncbi:MAG: tRNA (N(6)-L-threonylcarbamoyladenosine(37)-C(2))-methylthiotransferase MtaB [Dehalococcoidia bacterium]|nr:MAG: tRNA (N(6)-L-threonylcarbamoyladenosine(37)-C(2))-methylthiotransferase MtaB [Dehalococcoidia bacterium]